MIMTTTPSRRLPTPDRVAPVPLHNNKDLVRTALFQNQQPQQVVASRRSTGSPKKQQQHPQPQQRSILQKVSWVLSSSSLSTSALPQLCCAGLLALTIAIQVFTYLRYFPTLTTPTTSPSSFTKTFSQSHHRPPPPPLLSCRYDGHCPALSTCAVAPRNSSSSSHNPNPNNHNNKKEKGVCEPFFDAATMEAFTTATTPSFGISNSRSRSRSNSARPDCVEACLKELQVDEHWYHESWPVVEWSTDITSRFVGRPSHGCALVYHREPQENRFAYLEDQKLNDLNNSSSSSYSLSVKGIPTSLLNWVQTRFRHVKRVDYLHQKKKIKKKIGAFKEEDADDDPHPQQHHLWVAFCTAPCHVDADCATAHDHDPTAPAAAAPPPPPGFVCRNAACMRNPEYWGDNNNVPSPPSSSSSSSSIMVKKSPPRSSSIPKLDQQQQQPPPLPQKQQQHTADMVLVTGASKRYWNGLKNLAASARYWAPQYKLVVYHLGELTLENIAEIKRWSNVLAVEWEAGIPDHYPPHVHQKHFYAWKPIIVNETVHKYGSIFWLDSGSTLTGPIHPIQQVLQQQGIALMKGQDTDMRPRSHARTYESFGYDKDRMAVGPHFSGNTQAFLYPSRYMESMVIPNCVCALDPDCIAPLGSNLNNHRYDQTTISILAYQPTVRLPHYTEYLAAEAKQLDPDLRKPNFKCVWTARLGCQFYASHDAELLK